MPRSFGANRHKVLGTASGNGTPQFGPVQSNGMCLLERAVPVQSSPKPLVLTSTERPQVATWPGPTSDPGGLIVCTRLPGGVVGPESASARPTTRP